MKNESAELDVLLDVAIAQRDALLDALEQMLLIDSPRSAAHKESQGYQDGVVSKALAAIKDVRGAA